MARVLGLDLGSYSVKAVLFETQMRGYRTLAYVEERRPEGDKDQTLRTALAAIAANGELRADQVVVALPGPALATHVLSLPFTDPKRIEATIPFEVESQLPFDLSEAVYDYQIAAQDEKHSDLLIGVVRKKELAPLLEVLHELNLDPRIVTHPGIAYQNLLVGAAALFADAPAGPEAAPIAIIDVGHERTSVAIGRPGVGVELTRTFSGGGRDLSRALATEFQISAEEATAWKEAQGAFGAAAQDPESQRGSVALVRGLQPLLRELRPTLKAYTARTRQAVGRVYLCGGTSLLPGIAAQLTRELGIPTVLLALPSEANEVIAPAHQPSAVQAYALALRGQATGKGSTFNLRRGEYAFKGDFDYLREKLVRLAAFAAVLVVLLIGSGILRNQVLARREQQVEDQLCETTQRVLGKCERNFDRAINLLQGQESPAAAIPKLSAVALLAELMQRLPTDIPLTLDQVSVDLDRITVRCLTDSSKQVDKITTALKGYKCFKDVKEGKVEKTRDGQKVTFRLDIQVDCPDSPPAQG